MALPWRTIESTGCIDDLFDALRTRDPAKAADAIQRVRHAFEPDIFFDLFEAMHDVECAAFNRDEVVQDIERIEMLAERGDYLAAETALFAATYPPYTADTIAQYNAAPRWPEIHNQGVLK